MMTVFLSSDFVRRNRNYCQELAFAHILHQAIKYFERTEDRSTNKDITVVF